MKLIKIFFIALVVFFIPFISFSSEYKKETEISITQHPPTLLRVAILKSYISYKSKKK